MRPKFESESGETLAELLVTIALVGIAVVVLVGALATAIRASITHRQHTAADTIARSVVESFKDTDPLSVTHYVDCATSYPTTNVDTTGFDVTQTIAYWDGSNTVDTDADPKVGFSDVCTADKGVQFITVKVTSNTSRNETQTVSILKRRS